jgi:hypothetical protein
MIRHIATIFLIISTFILPFWVTAIGAICATIYFSEYYEIVLVAFISDILFAGGELRYHHFAMVTTVVSITLVFVVNLIRVYFFRER